MGGPYLPRTASLGGLPTVDLDVPICSVFLALFLAGGVAHIALFRRNLSKGHKFIPSALIFGFCMTRIVANSMRIAWACHPTNIRVAIAAQVFVAAGVLLLFILNLLFAQRMLRAAHPRLGWSRVVSLAFKMLYVLIVLTIAVVITGVVQRLYTLNHNTLRIDHDILLYGVTFFAIVSFLPLPIVLAVVISSHGNQVEEFGSGSGAMKALTIIVAAVLLCLGASFRAATFWVPPSPITHPPWYDSKACFYVFDFGLDITVVLWFLVTRVDQRFYVPDGSSKVRHYRGGESEQEKTNDAQSQLDKTGQDA